MSALDLVGQKFGRWTVQERAENTKRGYTQWLCVCDCGIKRVIVGASLKIGNSKSCGCYNKQRIKETHTTHGHCSGGNRSKTYRAWISMIARCTCPTDHDYKDYGAKGITVCSSWLNFENFLADMGEVPKGLTLDRRNNKGIYEPSNCRWISNKRQQNNKNSNVLVEVGGCILTISELADIADMNYFTLYTRLRKIKWTIEKAVLTPIKTQRRLA